jgi:kynurenine formamidase
MKVTDLTQEISPQTKVFPGYPQPHFIQWAKFDVHGYDSEIMFLSTHTGTHIDAPSHFVRNGKSIDQIQVDRFISKALLFKIPKGSNETINISDIINEQQQIEKNDTIIFSTGWEKRINEYNYLSNPGLSEEVAKLLVSKQVNMIGIDGPSIDVSINPEFPVHKILLSNDILIIENLCNLETFEHCSRFEFMASPLKLREASGSTIRAIAIRK